MAARISLDSVLAIDGAITANQARRWVATELPEPDRVISAYGLRYPVYVSPQMQKADDGMVIHAAMVGEMRRILQAPSGAWESFSKDKVDRKGLVPDAVWRKSLGEVAIEFDAGRYPRNRVETKLRHFSRWYAGQIWGVISPTRVEFIQELARELGIPRPPVFVIDT